MGEFALTDEQKQLVRDSLCALREHGPIGVDEFMRRLRDNGISGCYNISEARRVIESFVSLERDGVVEPHIELK